MPFGRIRNWLEQDPPSFAAAVFVKYLYWSWMQYGTIYWPLIVVACSLLVFDRRITDGLTLARNDKRHFYGYAILGAVLCIFVMIETAEIVWPLYFIFEAIAFVFRVITFASAFKISAVVIGVATMPIARWLMKQKNRQQGEQMRQLQITYTGDESEAPPANSAVRDPCETSPVDHVHAKTEENLLENESESEEFAGGDSNSGDATNADSPRCAATESESPEARDGESVPSSNAYRPSTSATSDVLREQVDLNGHCIALVFWCGYLDRQFYTTVLYASCNLVGVAAVVAVVLAFFAIVLFGLGVTFGSAASLSVVRTAPVIITFATAAYWLLAFSLPYTNIALIWLCKSICACILWVAIRWSVQRMQ